MEIFIQRVKTIIAFNFTLDSFFFSFLCVIALPFFSCALLVTSCCCLYHLSADDKTSNVLKCSVKKMFANVLAFCFKLSIDMHCSHVRICCSVVHTHYYLELDDACIRQHVCNGCLLCVLASE